MSDVSRYFPLSQRPRVDESKVSNDWRPVIAENLTRLATVLGSLSPGQWDAALPESGLTARAFTGQLLWRLASSRPVIAIDTVQVVLEGSLTPTDIAAAAILRRGGRPEADLLDDLRAAAADRGAGLRRHGVSDLARVVILGYDAARASGAHIDFTGKATGAVALARYLTAPTGIRAVIRDRSMKATDHGWVIGKGKPLAAPARELIEFLYGRSREIPAG